MNKQVKQKHQIQKFVQQKNEVKESSKDRVYAVRKLLYNISKRIILQVINEKRKQEHGTKSIDLLQS